MDNPANLDKAKTLKAAQMFFREGEWDKALTEYGRLLAIDRNDPDSLAAVADTYAKKKSFQLAFEFYFKAVPQYLVQNRLDGAIQSYKKISKLDLSKLSSDVRMDMNIYIRYVEIDEAIRDKRYEFAIAPLSKLSKLRPQDPMIPALLKAIRLQIDQIAPSVQRYQTLGDTFMRNDFSDRAWDMYRKAADMDPQTLSTLPELATTFVKQNHPNEAKKAYLYLAEQSLAKADLGKAIEYSQKAIELKSLEAGYILGLAHFQKRNWLDAKTEFEKLLRIKVNHLGALTHLARTFVFLSQPEKAKETFQKAFKIDENNPMVQEAWVDFCLQGPDKEAAIPQLAFLLEKVVTEHNAQKILEYSKIMIQIRPDLVSARVKLIQALQALGDLQGAADACRSLALVYEQQGLLNESAEYLAKADQLDPDHQMATKPASPPPSPSVSEQPPPVTLPTIPDIPLIQESEPIVDEEEPAPEPSERPKPAPQPVVAAQAPPPIVSLPPEPIPIDGLSAQMTTAQICVNQGLLRAAIDIYQQILTTNPDMPEARQKLAEVNALYLKKWMEKKK